MIIRIYTVGHKKRATFIFSITLANIDGFRNFFTARPIFRKELWNKSLLKFSPHLKSVAALPVKLEMSVVSRSRH